MIKFRISRKREPGGGSMNDGFSGEVGDIG